MHEFGQDLLVLETSHIPQNYVALVHFDYFEVLDIHPVSHTQGERIQFTLMVT